MWVYLFKWKVGLQSRLPGNLTAVLKLVFCSCNQRQQIGWLPTTEIFAFTVLDARITVLAGQAPPKAQEAVQSCPRWASSRRHSLPPWLHHQAAFAVTSASFPSFSLRRSSYKDAHKSIKGPEECAGLLPQVSFFFPPFLPPSPSLSRSFFYM